MQAPADQDPERRFFRLASRYLYWTWRLYHRTDAAIGTAEVIERRGTRADQMAQTLADLRSFKRMAKDLNTYRASFQFPKLGEQQMKVRIPAPAEIQLHQATKDRWEAWYYSAVDRRVTAPLLDLQRNRVNQSTLPALKEKVRDLFEKQTRGWECFDAAGKVVTPTAAAPAEAEAS